MLNKHRLKLSVLALALAWLVIPLPSLSVASSRITTTEQMLAKRGGGACLGSLISSACRASNRQNQNKTEQQ